MLLTLLFMKDCCLFLVTYWLFSKRWRIWRIKPLGPTCYSSSVCKTHIVLMRSGVLLQRGQDINSQANRWNKTEDNAVVDIMRPYLGGRVKCRTPSVCPSNCLRLYWNRKDSQTSNLVDTPRAARSPYFTGYPVFQVLSPASHLKPIPYFDFFEFYCIT